MLKPSATKIAQWSRRGGVFRRKLAQRILVLLFSFDLQPTVEVGKNVQFIHNSLGTVLHSKTVLKDEARIFQGVTLGDGNSYVGYCGANKCEGIIIGKRATICCNATVLCSDGVLEVGDGAIVAAGAVLTQSIGPNEIWGGVPAHFIKIRDDSIDS